MQSKIWCVGKYNGYLAYHRKILKKIVQAKEKGEEFKPGCQFKALQFLRKQKNYKDDSVSKSCTFHLTC